jgi:hypothetical protein
MVTGTATYATSVEAAARSADRMHKESGEEFAAENKAALQALLGTTYWN